MNPKPIAKNTLFYGDNLPILREHLADESVDLVYLDPPFNSNRSYNVLFKEESGKASESQLAAFDDTWHWGEIAESEFYDLTVHAPLAISKMIAALRELIGANQMMAYLVMMTTRLVELHRVLKPTGSLYLHCDPTASHYLKIILDTIFGPEQFRNEIVWRRTGSHNSAKRYGPIHDILLFYTKSDQYYFKVTFRPYLKGHVNGYFNHSDTKGRYWTNALTGAGIRHGDSGKPWKRHNPTDVNRHWAIPGKIIQELGINEDLSVQEKLDALDSAGYIDHPPITSNSLPTYRQYLESSPGMMLQDIWAYQPHTQKALYGTDDCVDEDVRWLVAQGDTERLGYPTQKPLGVLERVINSSCPENGTVLDPFCGCGTAIAAAEKLGRHWIGIDITHLAISLIKYRMKDMFPACQFEAIGEPQDLDSARQLAKDDRYQFQWWALSLVRARPVGGEVGSKKGKKGSDQGIDGVIHFHDDASGAPKQALVQVKSGHVKSGDIRDLHGALEREKAVMGMFITLEPPTSEMRKEALSAGYYTAKFTQEKYPEIQIVTVEELLAGKRLDMPPDSGTFKQAPKAKKAEGKQGGLGI